MVFTSVLFFVLARQAGPTATVQQFVAALNAHDLAGAAKLVKGGKSLPVTEKDLTSLPKFKLEGTEEKIDGETATVTGTMTVDEGNGHPPETMPESANLVRENGAWLLVGRMAGGSKQDVVQVLAYLMSHPELMQRTRDVAKANVCLSNAKQLALGVLMYTNDNDDKFPKVAAKVHDAIFPYTKNRKLWFCPEHPDMVAFTFNSSLLGKTSTSVAEPANTVMIYQGHDGKLDFDAEGKAVIAFADGHVKRLTKDEASKVRWKP